MKGNIEMKKSILLLTIFLSLVVGFASCDTDNATLDYDTQETVEGYLATFILDEHVTVTVYDTQDYY